MGKSSRRKKDTKGPKPGPTNTQGWAPWAKEAHRKAMALALRIWRKEPSQASAAEIFRSIHQGADANISRVFDKLAQLRMAGHPELKVACTKGCGYCCSTYEVTITAAEVLSVADYIQKNYTPEQRAELDAKLDARNRASEQMTDDEKNDSRRPCPMLIDGSCSIYHGRPLSCRTFQSLDVQQCINHFNRLPATIPMVAEFDEGVRPLLHGVLDAFSEMGHPINTLWFSQALEIALREGAAKAWCDGGNPFADVSKEENDRKWLERENKQEREVHRYS